MSFVELDRDPEKFRLMNIAFTLVRGRNDGEYARELNPKFIRMRKQRWEKMQRVQDGMK